MQGHFKLGDFGVSEGNKFESPYVISSEDYDLVKKDEKLKETYPIETLSKKSINSNNSNNINNNSYSNDANIANNAMGTINFMSPEIIKGEIEAGEGDYWSLGVIIYLIFTRTLPFESKEEDKEAGYQEVYEKIIENKINWEKLQKTSINIDLLDVVKGFLKYDKHQRLCNLDDIKKHNYFKGNLNIYKL